MSLDLPAAIAGYFAAKNAHDVDAVLSFFADDASVKDEGQELRGHPAIRAWITETTRRYRVTVAPTAVERADAAIFVTALVTGDFPGSPATLRYRFKIADGKISTWEIA